MVAAPSEYPWSSYRANALGHRSRVITTHPLYQSLGASDDARQAAYRRLFETELDARLLQRLRESANGGFVLGTDRFARQNAAMVGRRTWKGSPGRPRTRPDDQGQGPLPL
jgi:putative transposase